MPAVLAPPLESLRRAVHRTIAAVTEDLDKFRFNRAVAHIRELTNAIEALEPEGAGAGAVLREAIETAVRLIGPMMPHLAEELWQALGHDRLLADAAWPQWDAALAREETVTLAVQVNGKLRGTVDLPRDAADGTAADAALALPAVQRLLEGRAPRKTIVVPESDRQCGGLSAHACAALRRGADACRLRLPSALCRPRRRSASIRNWRRSMSGRCPTASARSWRIRCASSSIPSARD